MIGSSNDCPPDNNKTIDGVTPVDMFVSLEQQLDVLEEQALVYLNGLTNCIAYGTALESVIDNPNVGQLNAFVQQFEKGAPQISLEDISNTAKKNWDKTSTRLKDLQNNSIEFGRVIGMGIDKMVIKTDSLLKMSQGIKTEPYAKTITLSGPTKFNIDGKLEPRDVSRIADMAISAFAFYDKSLLRFMDSVIKLIDTLSFEDNFVDKVNIDWSTFSPTKWMSKSVEVKEDDRFRVNVPLYRTQAAQRNRAIYASGPTLSKTEDVKNWAFMVNMVRDMSFRYYTVPDLKPAATTDGVIEVDRIDGIQHRLGLLLNLSKRLQSRKGYESKLAVGIRKLGESGSRVRNKAGTLRVETGQMNGKTPSSEEPTRTGQPAVSDVVQSTAIMLSNIARMITDYNNAMAGIVRTVGALVHVTEQELLAYQPPLKQPTPEQVKRNV